MDEQEKLTNEIAHIAKQTGFNDQLLLKDYYLTHLLYAIRNIPEAYFKGGTALNKIFLDHARLSEDIDFTVRNLAQATKYVYKQLPTLPFIHNVTTGKNTPGFIRIICHYKTFSNEDETIYIVSSSLLNVL